MTKSQVQSSRCLQCFRKLVGGGEVFIPFLYNFRGPRVTRLATLMTIPRRIGSISASHAEEAIGKNGAVAVIVLVIHKQHFLKTDLDNTLRV